MRTGRIVAGGEAAKADAAETPPERPNVTGDLDDLLGLRPVFRTRQRGYDRLQVDNYVDWAESESAAARRQIDQLLDRYGACAAQLEISRRLLADAQRGRDVFPVSDRVEGMLRLAADEAAAMTEAGAEDADRLRAEARSEAEEILRAAAVERERLDQEAAAERRRADQAATAHLLTLQERVDGLCRRSDEARESLRQMADRVGQALEVVVGGLPDVTAPPDRQAVPPVRMIDNIVSDTDTEGTGGEGGGVEDRVVVRGRPRAVPS